MISFDKGERYFNCSVSAEAPEDYKLRHLVYSDISYKDNAFAEHIHSLPETSEEIVKIKGEIEEYNNLIDALNNDSAFMQEFVNNGFSIRGSGMRDKGYDTSRIMADLESYCFDTPLRFAYNSFFDKEIKTTYELKYEKETITFVFPIDECRLAPIINGKTVIWNLKSENSFFTYSLWKILGCPIANCDNAEYSVNYSRYKEYESTKDQPEYVEPQLISIFRFLKQKGYISTYEVFTNGYNLEKCFRWIDRFGESKYVNIALVDTSFLNNPAVMSEVNKRLWASDDYINQARREELVEYLSHIKRGTEFTSLSEEGGGFECEYVSPNGISYGWYSTQEWPAIALLGIDEELFNNVKSRVAEKAQNKRY